VQSDGLGKWSALNESLPGRIFISYRRQETAWPARQLYDVLVEHFPAEQVFKDIDNIDPGDEFVERITAAVESCDVLLALIGPQWLAITNKKGQRRLDDPEDYVRLEIETALTRKIRVIPILVDEAQMPGADELPATLAPLVRRNAVEINPVTFDTKRLISTVHKTLAALKVSDTTTRSASPTPTASPDRSNQQVAGPEVEQLYDQALAAFWTEQWGQAVDLLGQVLHRQPDYAEAARKLELARRQEQLAMHYAQASVAADAGDWEQAVAGYTMVADSDPDYRDTNARLAEARHQQQLASLLAEAHRLHRAGQWAAVIKVGEQLQAIDPAAADPDGLITSAHAELAADQQAAKLAADYHTGLHLFDAGRWEEAIEALERVTRLDSAYQDAPALLNRARRELGQATAAQAEEQDRQAEEQARRQTEQRGHTPRKETLPTFHEQAQQGRIKAEPSNQVQRPRHESRKYSRWTVWLTLAALLVVGSIATIALVNNGDKSNTNPTTHLSTVPARPTNPAQPTEHAVTASPGDYDKLLSHLPVSERASCKSNTLSAEELAEAKCYSGIYGFWEDGAKARSWVLGSGRKEGTCLRPPSDGAGFYESWSKDGMSGLLTCRYENALDEYFFRWSIDQLGISAFFASSEVKGYNEMLSEALRIRDQVK
jgi:tetratricopeptide (TPR) repeat protein